MTDKARGCIRASDRRVQSMRVEQAGTAGTSRSDRSPGSPSRVLQTGRGMSMRFGVMSRSLTMAVLTAVLAFGLVAPVEAQRQNRGDGYRGGYAPRGDWQGGRQNWYHGPDRNSGAFVGVALLGLGAGALLGGALVRPPPVVYAPQPYYYAPPPGYAYPYAPPPPVYYDGR